MPQCFNALQHFLFQKWLIHLSFYIMILLLTAGTELEYFLFSTFIFFLIVGLDDLEVLFQTKMILSFFDFRNWDWNICLWLSFKTLLTPYGSRLLDELSLWDEQFSATLYSLLWWLHDQVSQGLFPSWFGSYFSNFTGLLTTCLLCRYEMTKSALNELAWVSSSLVAAQYEFIYSVCQQMG